MEGDNEPVIIITRKQVRDMMLTLLKDPKVQDIIDQVMTYLTSQLHAYAVALGIYTVATYQSLAFSKNLGRDVFEKELRASKVMAELFKENVDNLTKYIHETVVEGKRMPWLGGRM